MAETTYTIVNTSYFVNTAWIASVIHVSGIDTNQCQSVAEMLTYKTLVIYNQGENFPLVR